ncbi:MAG: hypothetical protein R3C12_25450 [Planctomycetaceae bacterium]
MSAAGAGTPPAFFGGVYARARWRNIDFTPRHLLRLSGWWGLLGLWGVLWLLALLLQFLASGDFFAGFRGLLGQFGSGGQLL